MKHLDLFSGIGGFALAARNVGWETIGFCEIDPWCRKVLEKHWPGVKQYEEICDVTEERLRADGLLWETGETAFVDDSQGKRCGYGDDGENKRQTTGKINASTGTGNSEREGLVITGGFPCQDISHAGKQAGIEGERSGLWTELCRVIGEVRPRYAVLENVAALLSGDRGRWFQRVLGDLAEIGYDCEWHCIPASHVGAPHRRDRVWITAYPQHPDTDITGSHQSEIDIDRDPELRHEQVGESGQVCETVSDPIGNDLRNEPRRLDGQNREGSTVITNDGEQEPVAHTISERGRSGNGTRQDAIYAHACREIIRHGNHGERWSVEPSVCGVVDGVRTGVDGYLGRVANNIPDRVNRLRGLGNAIVPQVAQVIFEGINEVSK